MRSMCAVCIASKLVGPEQPRELSLGKFPRERLEHVIRGGPVVVRQVSDETLGPLRRRYIN